MKKLLTFFAVLFSITFLNAQQATVLDFRPNKAIKFKAPVTPFTKGIKYGNSNSSRALACDTVMLDYGGYDYYYGIPSGLNNIHSQYNYTSSSQGVIATELTIHIDSLHLDEWLNASVTFDTIVQFDFYSNTDYIPTEISTMKMDSVYLSYGLNGDSASFTNLDSLNFEILVKSVGTTNFSIVSKQSLHGSDLLTYITPNNFLKMSQFPLFYQFAKGDKFKIRCAFSSPDTSHHFYLTYSYNDSCGTIPYQGQSLPSPAYPSSLYGRSECTQIMKVSGNIRDSLINSTSTFNIPGVGVNCSYVYAQNIDIMPVVTVCQDYSCELVYTKYAVCTVNEIPLTVRVYGVSQNDKPNLTYTWSLSSGTFINYGSGYIALKPVNVYTTVMVEVNNAGSIIYDTLVVVNDLLNVLPIPTNPNCNSQNGSIFANTISSSFSFEFKNAQGNVIGNADHLTNLPVGKYTLQMKNHMGCIFNDTFNLVSVSNIQATTTVNPSNCNLNIHSGLATANVSSGNGPFTYQWTTCDSFYTTQTISYLPANCNLSLRIFDVNGCTTANPLQAIILADTNCSQPCNALFFMEVDTNNLHSWIIQNRSTSDTTLTYFWTWGDGTTSTGVAPTHTYSQPGFYPICLQVNDGLGCTDTYCDSSTYTFKTEALISIRVIDKTTTKNSALGIQNITDETLVQIYPNPTTGILTINTKAQIQQLRVFDLLGQCLLTFTKESKTINLKALQAGVYLLAVDTDKGTVLHRLIKNNSF